MLTNSPSNGIRSTIFRVTRISEAPFYMECLAYFVTELLSGLR
jgi:hypothetical protein